MIFVLNYNKLSRRVIDLRVFDDAEHEHASRYKASLQVDAVERGIEGSREIVLFRADSAETLKRTHGSYFLTDDELVDRAIRNAESAARHSTRGPRGLRHR
ncbi:MAG TPA: hypothetical protein VG815_07595 [Chloroflexota bacterium]|nr:hypothetical protein [Chloroflexota bacterium]